MNIKAYCHIEPLTTIHLPQVASIEKRCHSRPLEQESIRELCIANGDPRSQGIVALHEARMVAGFAVYRINKTSIEIITGGIHIDYRLVGVATQLIEHIKQIALIRNEPRVIIGVDPHQVDLQKFLKHVGFVCDKIVDEQSWHCSPEFYRFVYYPGIESTINRAS